MKSSRSLFMLVLIGFLSACGQGGSDLEGTSVPTATGSTAASAPANATTSLSTDNTPAPVKKDVPYVPTPQPVVEEMLRMAKVGPNDLIYDLGSGDGRILITAAQKYGARGVGIDIDPARIQEAQANAQAAGVEDKVEFRQQDLFATDFSEATVVTLYLLQPVNMKLRPRLLTELKPGTRIVSHAFNMGNWQPEQTAYVGNSTIYLWTVPANPPKELLQPQDPTS